MPTWKDIAYKYVVKHDHTAEAAGHLVAGNTVVIPDPDGDLIPFLIRRDSLTAGPGGKVKLVECVHLYYELAEGPIRSYTLANAIPSTAIAAALAGTRWTVGNIAPELATLVKDFRAIHVNPLELLRLIEKGFEARLKFRVEINGTGISAYKVDLVEIEQVFSGKRFEFGRDLQDITIAVDHSDIKTALFGYSLGEEIDPATGEPLPMTFRDVEWRRSKGDPADKPKGQDWVGNETARELYGIYDPATGKMLHRFGKYESQAETPEGLLEATWLIGTRYHFRPRVTVEGAVADLERVKVLDMWGPEIKYRRPSPAIHPDTGEEIPEDTPVFVDFAAGKKGSLMEEGTTNLLATRTSPAPEVVAVSKGQKYTLSAYGSGNAQVYQQQVDDTPSDFQQGTLSDVVATAAGDLELLSQLARTTIDCESGSNPFSSPAASMTIVSSPVHGGSKALQANTSANVRAAAYGPTVQRSANPWIEAWVYPKSGYTQTPLCGPAVLVQPLVADRYFDGYAALIDPRNDSGSEAGFQLRKGGERPDLLASDSSVVITPNQWYRVRLEVNGNTITAKLWNAAGALLSTLSVTNTTYQSGTFGIAFLDPAVFDDITMGGLYAASGTRTSPPIDLSTVGTAAGSSISWTATTPAGTSVTVETNLSLDGGQTWQGWQQVTNGGPIPDISAGTDLSNARLQTRVTLQTTDPTVTPRVDSLTIEVDHQAVAVAAESLSQSSPLTFTAVGNRVRLVPSAGVTKWQLEQKPFATSFTDGTRAAPLKRITLPEALPEEFGVGVATKMLHAHDTADRTFWECGGYRCYFDSADNKLKMTNGTATVELAVTWAANDIIGVYAGRQNGKLFLQAKIAGAVGDKAEQAGDAIGSGTNLYVGSKADGSESVNAVVADFVLHTGADIDPVGYLSQVPGGGE